MFSERLFSKGLGEDVGEGRRVKFDSREERLEGGKNLETGGKRREMKVSIEKTR